MLFTFRAAEALGLTVEQFARLPRREAIGWLCHEERKYLEQQARDENEQERWTLLLRAVGVKIG